MSGGRGGGTLELLCTRELFRARGAPFAALCSFTYFCRIHSVTWAWAASTSVQLFISVSTNSATAEGVGAPTLSNHRRKTLDGKHLSTWMASDAGCVSQAALSLDVLK